MTSPDCAHTNLPTKSLIVITGTNASGKSQLAIDLAQHFGGEIVSADSRQIYRGLNLGTGKVTQAQRLLVPHHLLDVADVNDNFTLGNFLPLAEDAIRRIHDKGMIPFLVGGTGLYISAIVEGYSIPRVPPNVELRRHLEAMSGPELVDLLRQRDPDASGDINPNNMRRMIRALEVCIQTGKPFSQQAVRGTGRYRTLVLGLSWPRKDLYRMIDARVDNRIHEGMIEEVRDLLNRGVEPKRLWDLGLEYRIISQLLLGEISSEQEMIKKLKFAIHHFARRQLSWFRRKPYVHWLDCTKDYQHHAGQLIEGFLSSPRAQVEF